MNVVLKCQSKQIREAYSLLLQLLRNFDSAAHAADTPYFCGCHSGYNLRLQQVSLTAFAEPAVPGRFLVDIIPILRYVPTKKWKAATTEIVHKPFEIVKSDLSQKKGMAKPSIVTSMIEEMQTGKYNNRPLEELIYKNADAIAFAVYTFFLAVAIYPNAQKKAQAEIDQVVGANRLPGFSDRESLMYVNAFIKEVLRWQSVVPLTMPRMSTKDHVYEGYFIPKGTVVLGGGGVYNPNIFNDLLEFSPERFLKNGKLDLDILM
ncbi:hypothetical protein M422DRAFT_241309 [Sphaerobolus stellatus SS14]|nr:hypothetical protein M422DRAFT_241309 [Sphaerobolus stellatus SS14]